MTGWPGTAIRIAIALAGAVVAAVLATAWPDWTVAACFGTGVFTGQIMQATRETQP